jgi:hypothetical protein
MLHGTMLKKTTCNPSILGFVFVALYLFLPLVWAYGFLSGWFVAWAHLWASHPQSGRRWVFPSSNRWGSNGERATSNKTDSLRLLFHNSGSGQLQNKCVRSQLYSICSFGRCSSRDTERGIQSTLEYTFRTSTVEELSPLLIPYSSSMSLMGNIILETRANETPQIRRQSDYIDLPWWETGWIFS